jgi:hypothetical protein
MWDSPLGMPDLHAARQSNQQLKTPKYLKIAALTS